MLALFKRSESLTSFGEKWLSSPFFTIDYKEIDGVDAMNITFNERVEQNQSGDMTRSDKDEALEDIPGFSEAFECKSMPRNN